MPQLPFHANWAPGDDFSGNSDLHRRPARGSKNDNVLEFPQNLELLPGLLPMINMAPELHIEGYYAVIISICGGVSDILSHNGLSHNGRNDNSSRPQIMVNTT